mmetsp:Transcript_27674/g.65728  ORF Transcript_27674/g.65728 Transcript_27674/m.65728 type:complete len:238 (-) Transcript_27674:298-1011(-)
MASCAEPSFGTSRALPWSTGLDTALRADRCCCTAAARTCPSGACRASSPGSSPTAAMLTGGMPDASSSSTRAACAKVPMPENSTMRSEPQDPPCQAPARGLSQSGSGAHSAAPAGAPSIALVTGTTRVSCQPSSSMSTRTIGSSSARRPARRTTCGSLPSWAGLEGSIGPAFRMVSVPSLSPSSIISSSESVCASGSTSSKSLLNPWSSSLSSTSNSLCRENLPILSRNLSAPVSLG